MEAINYESMKTNEPTRNFDSVDITNDYNVAAQNAQGLYGAFKFFHGIKSFFKGISALGTLATTSKIPVTDNDGNVTYTTPTAIKTALSLVDTTALNGALANYDKLNTSGTYTDANDCIPELLQKKRFLLSNSASNIPISAGGCVIEATRQYYSSESFQSCFQILYQNSTSDNTLIAMYKRNGYKTASGNTWTWGDWVKVIDETDLAKYSDYDYKTTPIYYKVESDVKTQFLLGGRGGNLIFVSRFASFVAKELYKNAEDNITNFILAYDSNKNVYITLKASMGLCNISAIGGTIKVTKIDSLPSGLTNLSITS